MLGYMGGEAGTVSPGAGVVARARGWGAVGSGEGADCEASLKISLELSGSLPFLFLARGWLSAPVSTTAVGSRCRGQGQLEGLWRACAGGTSPPSYTTR